MDGEEVMDYIYRVQSGRGRIASSLLGWRILLELGCHLMLKINICFLSHWWRGTVPLTSAPAEKNRPSPVRTVKTV